MPDSHQKKDEREWTTSEQKVYLKGKMDSYLKARSDGKTKSWFLTELDAYFKKFPVSEITEAELAVQTARGRTWTIQDKRDQEEKVSVGGRQTKSLPWRVYRGSEHGSRTTVVPRNLLDAAGGFSRPNASLES